MKNRLQNTMRLLILPLLLVMLSSCRPPAQSVDAGQSSLPISQPMTPTVSSAASKTAVATAETAPTVTAKTGPTVTSVTGPAATSVTGPAATPVASQAPLEPVDVNQAVPSPVQVMGVEPTWGYKIIDEFPHDATAYTQGLEVDDESTFLLEGTGRDSSLRRVDLETGAVTKMLPLADNYFGEGITQFEDRIIQLTWRAQQGFVYDSETFAVIDEFTYPHEGWGLTHDDRHLIVSDGTNIIRFWDPQTFEEVRRIQVQGLEGPVGKLNELEYVNGEIWANIWFSDVIVRISPDDGRVLGWIDLSGIIDPQLRPATDAVLNGIAYDQQSDRLYVTGKLWPKLFEIEVTSDDGS